MKPITYSVVLVLMMVVGVRCDAPDFYGPLKAFFQNWIKCHKGYKGMSPTQDAAAMKCQALGYITNFDCFYSCWRHETGAVVNGKWNHPVAEKNMQDMWEKGHEAEAKQWYDDSHKCIIEYEKNNKWPTDYKGNCTTQASTDAMNCSNGSRTCPA